MNISLRKSSALQNSIQETIKSIKIEPVININEYVSTESTILNSNSTLINNDARRVALLVAYYNIRSLVGVANVSSGINMKLANAAFVDKRIAQLQDLIDAGVRDLDMVEKKIKKIRESDSGTRSYLHHDLQVSTSVLTSEQIAAFTSEMQSLKKQKQKLNDEILELNIKTEIPLASETVKILTEEGLI